MITVNQSSEKLCISNCSPACDTIDFKPTISVVAIPNANIAKDLFNLTGRAEQYFAYVYNCVLNKRNVI